MDQSCSIYNVSRNTRCWPAAAFYTTPNVVGINAYNMFMANSQTAIRRQVFKGIRTQVVENHIHHCKTNSYLKENLKRKIQHFSVFKNYLQNVTMKTPFKDAYCAHGPKIARQEIAARSFISQFA